MIHSIAIGCDHGGYERKEKLVVYLKNAGYSVKDFGCYDQTSMDYPDVAIPVAKAVAKGDFQRGILICTTGIGVSIAANKVKGIRCALCSDAFAAEMTRRHNDSNVLALSAHSLTYPISEEIVKIWLATEFEGEKENGERHRRRVQKIMDFEKE